MFTLQRSISVTPSSSSMPMMSRISRGDGASSLFVVKTFEPGPSSAKLRPDPSLRTQAEREHVQVVLIADTLLGAPWIECGFGSNA